MASVCVSTERIVAQVQAGQFEAPTPCEGWSVRDVANHLLSTLELGRALLSDEVPRVQAGPGSLPAEDLIGSDLLAAYRRGVSELVAVSTPDAVGRMHVTPMGEMPGAVLAEFTALDILVHGWDLAKATGQSAALDSGLADRILGFARETIGDNPAMRAPRIGPEVVVGDDADATGRLVAYLGRQP